MKFIPSLLIVTSSLTLADLHPLVTVRSLVIPQDGPRISVGPKQPFKPMPPSSPRTKSCEVKSGAGGDDSAAIMSAIKECNGGGRVVLAHGAKYTIGRAMDLRNLKI